MMKNLMLPVFIFIMLIISVYGCSDDGPTNTEPAINPPSAEAFNALRDAATDAQTQIAEFDAEDGISFTSKNGVNFTIPPGCLTLNGNPASGPAKLEYMELFDKSNMLLVNRPTMGVTVDGDKKLLISGGEFFTNVTQNDDTLKAACSLHLSIPGKLTGGIDKDMKLWKGHIDSDGNLAWEKVGKNATGAISRNELFFKANRYQVYFDAFGATNVDRFHSDPRPKTTLQVRPPKGYNFDNSAVYLSYDGEANALANLDTFNESEGLFSEHYGMVPLGLNMHIIFVTEENGQWRYAIKGVTVADNDLYTFAFDETVLGSKQDLVNAIKALP